MFLVKENGNVLIFQNKEEMERAGYEKADKEVTNEEWLEKGGFARVIDGEIVIGDTDEEKERYAKQHALDAIDAELDALGRKQIRSSAEIAEALVNEEEIPEDAAKYHKERHEQMEALREKRKKYA